jgi:hypothetical protein
VVTVRVPEHPQVEGVEEATTVVVVQEAVEPQEVPQIAVEVEEVVLP